MPRALFVTPVSAPSGEAKIDTFAPEIDTRHAATQRAVILLAEAACSPSFYQQFTGPQQLPSGHRPPPTREQWASGLSKALSKPGVRAFLRALVSAGHAALWGQNEESVASAYISNPLFAKARAQLLGRLDTTHWIALAGLCLIRMAQANAKIAFKADEWTDYSFTVMHFEEALRMGDASSIHTDLASLTKMMSEPLHQLIAQRLPHGLSEIILNVPNSQLVRELTC